MTERCQTCKSFPLASAPSEKLWQKERQTKAEPSEISAVPTAHSSLFTSTCPTQPASIHYKSVLKKMALCSSLLLVPQQPVWSRTQESLLLSCIGEHPPLTWLSNPQIDQISFSGMNPWAADYHCRTAETATGSGRIAHGQLEKGKQKRGAQLHLICKAPGQVLLYLLCSLGGAICAQE